jgi:hypothetical protein
LAADHLDPNAIRVLSLQPPLPVMAERTWGAFHRLRRRCPVSEGPSPWTWEALDAFLRLTGIELSPWEIELLEMLDDAWIRVVSDDKFQPEGVEDDG